MAAGGVDVRVENQIVRFVSSQAIDQELVVAQVGGQRSGDVVIKALDKPRATLVIDGEGRIIVHGTHRVDAARAAAKELLLRLGLDDSGLQTELGPVIASFNFDRGVNVESLDVDFSAGQSEFDQRLGCAVINDSRHNLKLYVWPNGKCVATEARHPNMVAMSAVYWKGQFEENNHFVAE
jgi:TATA-box binding protein (TBP) (component of TFIID and TFIIIB)